MRQTTKDCQLSIIVTAKDETSPSLQRFLTSVKRQYFPLNYELLTITDGTSESAKAIGIERARGNVVAIFASDNEIVGQNYLWLGYKLALEHGASTGRTYHYEPTDNILNRYFSLLGGNDPLSFYLGKQDKETRPDHIRPTSNTFKTHGDNGFFIKKSIILQSNLYHYFHIDNVYDVRHLINIETIPQGEVWHHTGGSLIHYLRKRLRYGTQHAFNGQRRYHLVDRGDWWRVGKFVFNSATVLPNLVLSIKGYLHTGDKAWFMHPVVSLSIALTYALILLNLGVKGIYQSLYALVTVPIRLRLR